MENNITISHEILVKAGYTNYKNDEYNSYYQKRIRGEGSITKYFVEIRKIDVRGFIGWFPSIQFNLKENGESVSVELVQWLNDSGKHTGITLEEIESYLEKVWIKLEGKNYED